MTFMPASSPCADTVPMVVHSARRNRPMIVVFVNYRLGIFAFGDGSGSKNLALKDQRLAIEWVVQHISDFGGDPVSHRSRAAESRIDDDCAIQGNITLAGESAGAVYVHAHVLTNAPIQRAILQSGSLHLSPPKEYLHGQALCIGLDDILSKQGYDIANAPVTILLAALAEAGVASMWLQLTEDLQGWDTKLCHVDQLLIGDVEYESAIWRNGVETMTAADIVACFDCAGSFAPELKRLYNIVADRPTACKLGALDFINDTRFTLPVITVRDAHRRAGKQVYHYVFDQANPWQASSRAHHAVDLTAVFGDLDFLTNVGATTVRQDVRDKWVDFCNGLAPWSMQQTYSFGPYGRCGEIATGELECRRRIYACLLLQQIGSARYDTVCGKLVARRISLLN